MDERCRLAGAHMLYIQPKARSRYSQKVSDTALRSVVRTMTLEVRMPYCPILFPMI